MNSGKDDLNLGSIQYDSLDFFNNKFEIANLQESVTGFQPKPEDLDYPNKLKSLDGSAESSQSNNKETEDSSLQEKDGNAEKEDRNGHGQVQSIQVNFVTIWTQILDTGAYLSLTLDKFPNSKKPL